MKIRWKRKGSKWTQWRYMSVARAVATMKRLALNGDAQS